MSDQGAKLSRSILPIPSQSHIGLTTYDAKDPNTKFPPIEPLRPPKGAPNVLIVLLDDVGFAGSSAFGGPCQTPNFDKLASGGLKYNRFHTTALCAPTRHPIRSGTHTIPITGGPEGLTRWEVSIAQTHSGHGRDAPRHVAFPRRLPGRCRHRQGL